MGNSPSLLILKEGLSPAVGRYIPIAWDDDVLFIISIIVVTIIIGIKIKTLLLRRHKAEYSLIFVMNLDSPYIFSGSRWTA